MKTVIFSAIFGILGLLPLSTKADLTFTVIADSDTVVPDSGGTTFSNAANLIADNGQIAFFGSAGATNGFYLSDAGNLISIVDSAAMVPDEDLVFGSFSSGAKFDLSNGVAAFEGAASFLTRGIYVSNNGQISSVARRLDPVPGGNPGQVFNSLSNPIINNGEMVFLGNFGTFTGGIYRFDGVTVTKILDSNDLIMIPGTTNQIFRSFVPHAVDGDGVVFSGGTTGGFDGIYHSSFSASVSVLVDKNTPIPDGVGTFISFDSRFPVAENGKLVFFGSGNNGQQGIYLLDDNQLITVADQNTIQPGSESPFSNLNKPVIAGGRVFFQGIGTAGQAIYEFKDGAIVRIVGSGDRVNGQILNSVISNELSSDGNTLVFQGRLDSSFATSIIAVDLGFALGDVNCDGLVNLLDVEPFVGLLNSGGFNVQADVNQDGSVNLLDIELFIDLLSGGGA